MKILLLGGTGAMGIHLVDFLSKESTNCIYVTSRSMKSDSGNIHYIYGNAHNLLFVTELMKEKFDIIVDFMVYNTEEFKTRMDLFLTNTSQYIYLSSSRVYANSDKPLTENSLRLLDVCNDKEYLSTDEYALTKARQENLLFDSKKSNYTIIRPYITYAENRLQLGIMEKELWLQRALKGKTVYFSKDIAEKYTTVTYGKDVAFAINAIIGKCNAYGEAFHITQQKSMKWIDVWNIYKDVLEKKTEREVKLELADFDTYCSIFKNSNYQIKYDRMYNRIFDNSKISNFINLANFIQPETGLSRCLSEIIQSKNFLERSYRIDGRIDAVLKEFDNPIKICGLKNKLRYIAGITEV